MSDIAQGAHVKLILTPGDVYRVGTSGVATVQAAYGAPAGTTTVTASTQEFGPYSAPAKLIVTAATGTTSYSLRSYTASSSASVSSSDFSVPAVGYKFAFRANQPGFGEPVDQSPAGKFVNISTRRHPAAWVANAAITLGAYTSPTAEDGVLYKCTTAGTHAATQAAWNSTIGGTTTQGTAVYTAEKGMWFIGADGNRYFRSLNSSQVGGFAGFVIPDTDTYDLNASVKQSMILRIRLRMTADFNTLYPAAAADGAVLYSTRALTGSNRGISLAAYGNANNSALRFSVRGASDAATTLSGQVLVGSGKRQVDGGDHEILMCIDGNLRMMFVFDNGIAYQQADMIGAEINPSGMNLNAVTGTTAGPLRVIGGGINSTEATNSFEFPIRAIDEIIINGSLPSNMVALANFCANNPTSLIPQALVQPS